MYKESLCQGNAVPACLLHVKVCLTSQHTLILPFAQIHARKHHIIDGKYVKSYTVTNTGHFCVICGATPQPPLKKKPSILRFAALEETL